MVGGPVAGGAKSEIRDSDRGPGWGREYGYYFLPRRPCTSNL